MTLSMDGESEPEPFVTSPFNEGYPAFSPDGRWLAYASDETGEFEVYVRPFPDGDPAYRISADGGSSPVWSPDGSQLYYRRRLDDGARSVMVVEVQTTPSFTRNQPRTLFEGPFGDTVPVRSWDVDPDGQRFVMLSDPSQVEAQPVTRINIVLNWFEELRRLVPTN